MVSCTAQQTWLGDKCTDMHFGLQEPCKHALGNNVWESRLALQPMVKTSLHELVRRSRKRPDDEALSSTLAQATSCLNGFRC